MSLLFFPYAYSEKHFLYGRYKSYESEIFNFILHFIYNENPQKFNNKKQQISQTIFILKSIAI